MGEELEKKPLFELSLGTNGGALAPYTAEELSAWLTKEVNFWSWINGINAGNHRNILDAPLAQLQAARQEAANVVAKVVDVPGTLQTIQNRIRAALLDSMFPHSSSALGKEVDELRKASPARAISFLFPQLNNPNNLRFEANGAPNDSWHGFIQGLTRHYGETSGKQQLRGQRQAFDELVTEVRRVSTDRQGEFDKLEADLLSAKTEAIAQNQQQAEDFQRFSTDSASAFSKAQEKYQAEMESLRKTFREEMSLRGPVEYWESRRDHHSRISTTLTKVTFGAIAVLAVLLAGMAAWAVRTSANPYLPDAWRLVMLAFVGALGVWAVRLIVRIFLSNMHLATDAAERVTMVKTYLALLEGEKLPSDDDRRLILQALFRPGSDGMVKDEGIPHPALDFLTRSK